MVDSDRLCTRMYFACMASYARISKCIQNIGFAQQKIFEYGQCIRRWVFNYRSVDLCVDAAFVQIGVDRVMCRCDDLLMC
jgi:hypothetical protein